MTKLLWAHMKLAHPTFCLQSHMWKLPSSQCIPVNKSQVCSDPWMFLSGRAPYISYLTWYSSCIPRHAPSNQGRCLVLESKSFAPSVSPMRWLILVTWGLHNYEHWITVSIVCQAQGKIARSLRPHPQKGFGKKPAGTHKHFCVCVMFSVSRWSRSRKNGLYFKLK